MPTSPYVTLIDCPDAKGIVHKVTGVLFEHDLNIDDQGQFVAKDTGRFFMRTSFDADPETFDLASVRDALQAIVPEGGRVRVERKRPRDVVILATKEPHCLGDLLIRHAYGELNARVQAVVSNHAKLGGLVASFGIPFHHVPWSRAMTRHEHEAGVLEVLDTYNPELLVLAKYMRILTPEFVARYPHRIINIHHSFLPAFIGAKPYHQAYKRGVKLIGATAHFVTDNLDEGPIIAQDVVHVDHGKSVRDMTRAGHNVETVVLSEALRLVLDDRVFVDRNRTVIFD